MLKRPGEALNAPTPAVRIADAQYPSPFTGGLEFSVPARGSWTIVHVGMLVPQAHEIFVCAAGCLRGVVLSAAEMNLTHRFSTVEITEANVLEGDMEDLIIEGVTDILHRLPALPPAVLLYTSCIHHFMGCDLDLCYRTLRERFPEVDFTDCYMIPTMRKSGLTPDQIMRRQLYTLLPENTPKEKACAVLGNCFSTEDDSDLVQLIRGAGWEFMEITRCDTYEEYKRLAACSIAIATQPVAKAGAEAFAARQNAQYLYLPTSCNAEEIRANLSTLAAALGCEYDGGSKAQKKAEDALNAAHAVIGDTPIAIDYSFTPRPLGLARLLLERGFAVRKVYLDGIVAEERDDFLALQRIAPDLELLPTVHPAMRKVNREPGEKWLALGQKAAYFTGTKHFVNLVENGGLYGFAGIAQLAGMMLEAFENESQVELLISQKGLGCESCI